MSNDIRVGGAYIDLNLKKDNFKSNLKDAQNATSKASTGMVKSTGNATKAMAKQFKFLDAALKATVVGALIIAARRIADLGKQFTEAGSIAEEVNNKFQAVFSTISEDATEATRKMAEAYGLSSVQAQKLIGNTADIVKGLGASEEQALSTALSVNKLAADLASFNNIPVEQASEALTKAYTGQRQSLQSLGIVIQEADVQQELLKRGMQDLTGEALRTATGQITLQLAMRQSGSAIGDVERSFNSYANTKRRLKAIQDDFYTDMGEKLTPAMAELNVALINLIQNGGRFRIVIDQLVGSLAVMIESLTVALNLLAYATDDLDEITNEIVLMSNAADVSFKNLQHLITPFSGELKDALQQTNNLGEALYVLDKAAQGDYGAGNIRTAKQILFSLEQNQKRAVDSLTKWQDLDEKQEEALRRRGISVDNLRRTWENLFEVQRTPPALDSPDIQPVLPGDSSGAEVEREKINLDELLKLREQYEANKFAITDNATQAILRQQQRETEGLRIEYEKQLAIAGNNLEDRQLVEEAYLESMLEMEAYHQQQSIEQWKTFGEDIAFAISSTYSNFSGLLADYLRADDNLQQQLHKNELARIKERYEAEIQVINDKEQAELASMGLLDEAKTQQLEKTMLDAIAANDQDLIDSIGKEMTKNAIQMKYADEREKKERELAQLTKDLEYDAAIQGWETQKSMAKIQSLQASISAYASTAAIPVVGPYLAPFAALAALAATMKNYSAIAASKPRKLAKGGLLDGPQLAIAGEAGKEAFLPLTNKTAMRDIAKAITDEMPGGSNNNSENNQPRVINLILEGEKIATYVEDFLSNKAKSFGGELYTAGRVY